MKFDYVLFDLDGTLTDSYNGITNAVSYSLAKSGVTPPPRAELRYFVGPPLIETFSEMWNGDIQKAEQSVAFYREYYSERGWSESSVYDGVPQMLQSLYESGLKLLVATSKPEYFTNRIIAHFGLDKYFCFVAGATLDNKRATKADVIAYGVKCAGVDVTRAVMVGDRDLDILGAKTNGLKSIGAVYGYGGKQELSSAGADFLADTPNDITEIILGVNS